MDNPLYSKRTGYYGRCTMCGTRHYAHVYEMANATALCEKCGDKHVLAVGLEEGGFILKARDTVKDWFISAYCIWYWNTIELPIRNRILFCYNVALGMRREERSHLPAHVYDPLLSPISQKESDDEKMEHLSDSLDNTFGGIRRHIMQNTFNPPASANWHNGTLQDLFDQAADEREWAKALSVQPTDRLTATEVAAMDTFRKQQMVDYANRMDAAIIQGMADREPSAFNPNPINPSDLLNNITIVENPNLPKDKLLLRNPNGTYEILPLDA